MGTVAPALALREDEDPERRAHLPRLLAFVRAWSTENEPAEELAHVRARLKELGAELVIVCEDGAWSFVRDREPVFCDRLAADARTATAAYGAYSDAVFVIDHRDVVRFIHRGDCSLSTTLTEALDAAAEALRWRSRQTPLERVQCSPREWSSKCLVTGCAVTFDTPVERTRFARGTGPIRTLSSRSPITVGADANAPDAIDESSSRPVS